MLYCLRVANHSFSCSDISNAHAFKRGVAGVFSVPAIAFWTYVCTVVGLLLLRTWPMPDRYPNRWKSLAVRLSPARYFHWNFAKCFSKRPSISVVQLTHYCRSSSLTTGARARYYPVNSMGLPFEYRSTIVSEVQRLAQVWWKPLGT